MSEKREGSSLILILCLSLTITLSLTFKCCKWVTEVKLGKVHSNPMDWKSQKAHHCRHFTSGFCTMKQLGEVRDMYDMLGIH